MTILTNNAIDHAALTARVPGRIARAANSRKVLAEIRRILSGGNTVTVTTYTRSWELRGAKYLDFFRVSDRNGALLMRRGKSWDDITGTAIRFWAN